MAKAKHTTVAEILRGVAMVENPEVEGGLVSADEIPLDEARRLVRELETAGFVADWAPAAAPRSAWLYVTL